MAARVTRGTPSKGAEFCTDPLPRGKGIDGVKPFGDENRRQFRGIALSKTKPMIETTLMEVSGSRTVEAHEFRTAGMV